MIKKAMPLLRRIVEDIKNDYITSQSFKSDPLQDRGSVVEQII